MSGHHTPGPWKVHRRTVYALDVHQDVDRFTVLVQGGYENGGQRIAFGDAPIRTSDEEILANVRLIKAAPDLLAAAQRMAAQLGGGNDFAEWEAAKADLLAAIAKATGKETNA